MTPGQAGPERAHQLPSAIQVRLTGGRDDVMALADLLARIPGTTTGRLPIRSNDNGDVRGYLTVIIERRES